VTYPTILLYTFFYPIYFLLRKRDGERERGRRRRIRRRREGTTLPFKTDSTLVIYKILKKTLVL
jgi:hypothetical protein